MSEGAVAFVRGFVRGSEGRRLPRPSRSPVGSVGGLARVGDCHEQQAGANGCEYGFDVGS